MNQHPSMTDREALELARRDFDQHLRDGLNNTQVDMVLKLAEKYMNETDRMRKELEEPRKVCFPRQMYGEGGWEIDYKFLDRVENVMISKDTEYPADTETIEAVLLALETVLGQEGEGNQ